MWWYRCLGNHCSLHIIPSSRLWVNYTMFILDFQKDLCRFIQQRHSKRNFNIKAKSDCCILLSLCRLFLKKSCLAIIKNRNDLPSHNFCMHIISFENTPVNFGDWYVCKFWLRIVMFVLYLFCTHIQLTGTMSHCTRRHI